MQNIEKYITINPEIRFGKPCINGTRIAVVDILQWLASGMTNQQIIDDFPTIKEEHILAALYFASHREELIKYFAAD